MIRTTLAALLSHWLRSPLQLAMLLTGLALATALWSGVQALNAEARAAYATAEGLLADGGTSHLEHPSGQIAPAQFVALRRAGWPVSPVLEGRSQIGAARVTVLGIDPFTAPAGAGTALAASDPGAFFAGLGYAHPQTIQEIGAAEMPLHPSPGVPVGLVLADIATAQALLQAEGQITRLTLAGPPPPTAPPLEALAPDLRLVGPGDGADLAGLTDSFHLNLTAFGLLAFAVGLFIVHSAVGLAFEQRRAMFRTLRALGLPLRHLTACL
ncbi:MAG: ABC transporter permease, partial [Roseinatronobacter sp.]|nr:ABC transporter permease [Roseinatronobacter sp.]